MHCSLIKIHLVDKLESSLSLSIARSNFILPHRQIKYPVDFDDELKIGDVRYDKITKITIKVQLF